MASKSRAGLAHRLRAVQRAIRRQAWRAGDIRYEDAVIELIRDLIIERSVEHDIAIMERERRWSDESF